jgi:hypothetical protein
MDMLRISLVASLALLAVACGGSGGDGSAANKFAAEEQAQGYAMAGSLRLRAR